MANETEHVMPTYAVPGIKWYDNPQSQAQKRRHHTLTDQFGRMFECVLDMTSKPHPAPVSVINPHGWSDPLNTPEGYKIYGRGVPGEAGGSNFFRVWIDVERWERDLVTAHADYEALVIAKAASMSPEDGGAAMLGRGPNDRSPHLLAAVGPKPQPVELVQALIAGNRWARGQTSVVPDWAKKLLPIPVIPAARTEDLDALRAKFPDADEETVPPANAEKRQKMLDNLANARAARKQAKEVTA